MADRQSSMFSFIKRGKRKAETDENKENYRPNKSTKVDHHEESSKKPSKQRTRHASEDKYGQDFKWLIVTSDLDFNETLKIWGNFKEKTYFAGQNYKVWR